MREGDKDFWKEYEKVRQRNTWICIGKVVYLHFFLAKQKYVREKALTVRRKNSILYMEENGIQRCRCEFDGIGERMNEGKKESREKIE